MKQRVDNSTCLTILLHTSHHVELIHSLIFLILNLRDETPNNRAKHIEKVSFPPDTKGSLPSHQLKYDVICALLHESFVSVATSFGCSNVFSTTQKGVQHLLQYEQKYISSKMACIEGVTGNFIVRKC